MSNTLIIAAIVATAFTSAIVSSANAANGITATPDTAIMLPNGSLKSG